MHECYQDVECYYFSRSPDILLDLQFVFENLLNFLCKQIKLAFVLWPRNRDELLH